MSAGAWLQSPYTVVRYIHMWTKTRLSDWQIIAISGLRIWNMLPAPSHLVRALKYICLIAAADLRRGLVTIFVFKVPCYLLIRNERKWVDLVTLTFGLLTAQVLVMCGTSWIIQHYNQVGRLSITRRMLCWALNALIFDLSIIKVVLRVTLDIHILCMKFELFVLFCLRVTDPDGTHWWQK